MGLKGFFFEEQAPVPIKPRNAAAARKQIQEGATGCDNCPLQATWNRLAGARMPCHGATRDGDILILGDGPNLEDDRAGGAFMGSVGKILRRAVPGRHQDRIVYQHLVRCSPGVDAQGETKLPTPQEAHACSVFLEEDLESMPIKAIVGLGTAVLARFFPGASMRDVHGTRMPVRVGRRVVWFYPVFDIPFLIKNAGKRSVEDGQAWPVFRADLKSFFEQVDRWAEPRIHDEDLKPGNIIIVNTEGEAAEVLAEMQGPVAIDLETNNLRPYNRGARLLIGSVSDGDLSMAFSVNHPDQQLPWALPFLLKVANGQPWMAHNLAFEYAWLSFFAKEAGLPFAPAEMHDTMALARIYHERESILSLEMLSAIHLGVNIKSVMNIVAARVLDYPLIEAQQYCGLDTMSCARIFKRLHRHMRGGNYERLVEASRTVADMALMGLDIDLDASRRLHGIWSAKAQEAAERAKTLYEVRAFERERGPFNIAAAQDVGIALAEYGRLNLPKTPGGKQLKTDDAALSEAAPDGHPLIDAVLAYREAAKMVSTYIEVVLTTPERCPDGKMHPGYTTMHTATLRLSSEDPNIQNWPSRKHKELRAQVKAPPGKVMVKFDYKALEARLIGMATRDRMLCSSIISGEDIHSKWRDKALAIYPEYIERLAEKTNQTDHKKILKGGRDIIKTDFVFASFFGSTADSCAKRTGMPLQYMQELSSEFWQDFTGVKAWIKAKRAEYKDTGSSRLLTNVVRHAILPGNEPINTPIQGSAAQIVVESMNALASMSRERNDPHLHPRINIHDDLTFFLPDDERLEGYINTIWPELVKIRFDWQIVPLAVEGAIGESWEALEEFGNFTGDYIR